MNLKLFSVYCIIRHPLRCCHRIDFFVSLRMESLLKYKNNKYTIDTQFFNTFNARTHNLYVMRA